MAHEFMNDQLEKSTVEAGKKQLHFDSVLTKIAMHATVR